jgi:hypothetical protein
MLKAEASGQAEGMVLLQWQRNADLRFSIFRITNMSTFVVVEVCTLNEMTETSSVGLTSTRAVPSFERNLMIW